MIQTVHVMAKLGKEQCSSKMLSIVNEGFVLFSFFSTSNLLTVLTHYVFHVVEQWCILRLPHSLMLHASN